MLHNTRIILVGTTHPGNIGAVARAMKNMGLSQLYLVKPKCFPHDAATARASGADDILTTAVITDSFTAALQGCSLVIGASARLRALPLPMLNPKECASKVRAESKQVAIVFGRENSGLTNVELQLCHYQLHIPAVAEFNSLNLAQAVQIVVYELKMACFEPAISKDSYDDLATAEEMSFFYRHLREVLLHIKFLHPVQAEKLMFRLQRLFNRARIEKTELNILRGILTAMQKVE